MLMALCACCSPEFNNGFWGFKTLLWFVLLIVTLFITNDVFDTTGYVWVARIGAFIFTIMQQIVLIDLAYRCGRVCVLVCFGYVFGCLGAFCRLAAPENINKQSQPGMPSPMDDDLIVDRC